jgi:hypothetical protein
VGWRNPMEKPISRLLMDGKVKTVILQFLKDTDIAKSSNDIFLSSEGFEWD